MVYWKQSGGATKSAAKAEEEMNMKVYYYETNGYNGILIANGDKWVSITDDKNIYFGYVIERANADAIGREFAKGIESGEFDEVDFQDWYDGAKFRGNERGYSPQELLDEFEYYQQIF